MTESDFNKRLKTLSLIALKVIIKGTGLKTKSELQTIISNEKELIPDEVKPYIELLLQKQ